MRIPFADPPFYAASGTESIICALQILGPLGGAEKMGYRIDSDGFGSTERTR
jgi:hypothetical protein